MNALDLDGVLDLLAQVEEREAGVADDGAGGFEPGVDHDGGFQPGMGHGGRRVGAGRHGGRGAGRGRGVGVGRGRARAGRGRLARGLRERNQQKKKRSKAFRRKALCVDHQARIFNSNGRSRNQDYHFPAHAEGLERKRTRGRSKWKQWSVEAILRAGFASENASRREASSAIDGAGAGGHHAGNCRFVVANGILRGQEKGIHEVCAKGCQILVRNLMFDESTLDLCVESPAASAWSILCLQAARRGLGPGRTYHSFPSGLGSCHEFRDNARRPVPCIWWLGLHL